MWLSEIKKTKNANAVSQGSITIGGTAAAVMTDAERRNVALCMPGGYVWIPKAGQSAISVSGSGGEQYILGFADNVTPENMQPGEVCIFSGAGAQILLKNNGTIAIKGDVSIEGSLNVNGDDIC